ncbi:MAG: dTDP-4-dehydrorhamnose 3,5-epimerase [Muribaculaceae bacterium]|nr:dTDP-4-dehydrorhamnose 3,5-epimerase [Muribaculaceae bacterium]MDE6321958.1 dTDP-4-dehydrorhamnose 3,5-epimerase [Muribaculaceae bacterium]
MKFTQLSISGVWLIEPEVHGDQRGYFEEAFRSDLFEANVGNVKFVQDNESLSSTVGVLRGLHFQRGRASQAKLVRVSQGRVADVVVDLRGGSPTYGQYLMVELSAENHRQLFVPRGMAHGFVVLEAPAQFQYKVDNYYAPGTEATLRYDDPAIGIAWPLGGDQLLLSEKDRNGMPLSDVTPFDPSCL